MLVVLSVAKKSKGVILRYTFAIYDGLFMTSLNRLLGRVKAGS